MEEPARPEADRARAPPPMVADRRAGQSRGRTTDGRWTGRGRLGRERDDAGSRSPAAATPTTGRRRSRPGATYRPEGTSPARPGRLHLTAALGFRVHDRSRRPDRRSVCASVPAILTAIGVASWAGGLLSFTTPTAADRQAVPTPVAHGVRSSRGGHPDPPDHPAPLPAAAARFDRPVPRRPIRVATGSVSNALGIDLPVIRPSTTRRRVSVRATSRCTTGTRLGASGPGRATLYLCACPTRDVPPDPGVDRRSPREKAYGHDRRRLDERRPALPVPGDRSAAAPEPTWTLEPISGRPSSYGSRRPGGPGTPGEAQVVALPSRRKPADPPDARGGQAGDLRQAEGRAARQGCESGRAPEPLRRPRRAARSGTAPAGSSAPSSRPARPTAARHGGGPAPRSRARA